MKRPGEVIITRTVLGWAVRKDDEVVELTEFNAVLDYVALELAKRERKDARQGVPEENSGR